jgi:hypothetical protein
MNQGTQGYSLTNKTEGRKSRDTVPLNKANTCVALPNACRRSFPSVITTIMDQKVQLSKPLIKRELYTTQQNQIPSYL